MKEIWEDVKGYENSYQISNYGKVKSNDRIIKIGNIIHHRHGKNIKLCVGTAGYQQFWLHKNGKRKSYTIHRLVAEHFLTKIKGKDHVNHKNSNKLNNHISNLEWVTPKENAHHDIMIGNRNDKGENNCKAKLTTENVLKIRKLIKTETNEKIAKLYKVSISAIERIKYNLTWRHV